MARVFGGRFLEDTLNGALLESLAIRLENLNGTLLELLVRRLDVLQYLYRVTKLDGTLLEFPLGYQGMRCHVVHRPLELAVPMATNGSFPHFHVSGTTRLGCAFLRSGRPRGASSTRSATSQQGLEHLCAVPRPQTEGAFNVRGRPQPRR